MTTDAVLDRPAVARRTARLLIVDGEAIVRFGLRQLFAPDPEITVVGEAASPRDALVIADRCPPDLVILDVDLGRGDAAGVELVRMLLERHRGVRVLVLTGCRDRDVMLRTIRLGVHGYLRKGAETAAKSKGYSQTEPVPGMCCAAAIPSRTSPPAIRATAASAKPQATRRSAVCTRSFSLSGAPLTTVLAPNSIFL